MAANHARWERRRRQVDDVPDRKRAHPGCPRLIPLLSLLRRVAVPSLGMRIPHPDRLALTAPGRIPDWKVPLPNPLVVALDCVYATSEERNVCVILRGRADERQVGFRLVQVRCPKRGASVQSVAHNPCPPRAKLPEVIRSLRSTTIQWNVMGVPPESTAQPLP